MIFDQKENFVFTGTYQEFIEQLKENHFWKSEAEFEEYLLKNRFRNENTFKTYYANFANQIIDYGEEQPDFPDRTVFVVETEGYTQGEINAAFGEALKELAEQRARSRENKGFSLNKLKWEELE
ncbi:hypothetical protein [Enterococcus xiangfangensis]|uniref:Uncharacterized protein n=1 Tax=Enterococcus xiangfangensis TaxID=1296537 RepID=A0ABU3FCI1_9ENTE|nr:hypothetical protein [Enterococcus xiangfangensis]MDT2760374.1 hypothetical protein [Enterococcus xiangfangensis]